MGITLIGMSGAGKSTVGKRLARQLGYKFYDVDREMEEIYDKPLQAILDELGDDLFLLQQSNQIRNLKSLNETVLAPGGSIVYTEAALEFVQKQTTIIYLDVSLETVKSRLDVSSRGIVGLDDKTFDQLYHERAGMYELWAEITIVADNKCVDVVVEEIIHRVVE